MLVQVDGSECNIPLRGVRQGVAAVLSGRAGQEPLTEVTLTVRFNTPLVTPTILNFLPQYHKLPIAEDGERGYNRHTSGKYSEGQTTLAVDPTICLEYVMCVAQEIHRQNLQKKYGIGQK